MAFALTTALREHLVGNDALSNVDRIERMLAALHPDEETRSAWFAKMFGPGLLANDGPTTRLQLPKGCDAKLVVFIATWYGTVL